METTNIYTLTDPRTNEIRYVGKANNISQRYQAHLNRARDHQTHKRNWVNSLRKLGLKPIIDVIDIVPIEDWVFWETYWINQIKSWGFKLTNNTDGGDGCTFGNKTSFKKGDGGKKVVGYDSNGEKKYEFDSTRQADDFLKSRSIWGVCVGKRKTAKKIAWFYLEDIINLNYEDLLFKIKNRFVKENKANSGSFKKGDVSLKKQKIGMYTLNNNLIKIFDSIGDAAKEVGVTNGAIQFACTRSKKSICKKYKWKYENN